MRTTWATETFYCSHDDIAAVKEERNSADFKIRKILPWILMNFEMQTRWRNPKQRDMKKKATKFDAINFIACTWSSQRNMKNICKTCKFLFSMLLNLERVRMCILAGLQDSYWVSNILTRFMILFTYFYDILQNVANMHIVHENFEYGGISFPRFFHNCMRSLRNYRLNSQISDLNNL